MNMQPTMFSANNNCNYNYSLQKKNFNKRFQKLMKLMG